VAPPKPPPSSPRGEEAFIERIASAVADRFKGGRAGELWIGDDAAVIAGSDAILLTADACVAGVHADLELVGLDDLGWKAMTSAISDIGAMGGSPSAALVTVCLPGGIDLDLLIAGLVEAAVAWSCPIVGGDVSMASELVVVVSVSGACDPATPGPVTRAGASPGDTLMVTGALGGSAAGLRVLREARAQHRPATGALVMAHRRPRCRIAEGIAARASGASAMIDVSDGASIDLYHLADASNVGISIDELPVAAGATLQEALGGGEDYELLIASPDPERLDAVFSARGLSPPARIGRCTADADERTFQGRPLERTGWVHRID
jgi:thiamine-monophosphate kinase